MVFLQSLKIIQMFDFFRRQVDMCTTDADCRDDCHHHGEWHCDHHGQCHCTHRPGYAKEMINSSFLKNIFYHLVAVHEHSVSLSFYTVTESGFMVFLFFSFFILVFFFVFFVFILVLIFYLYFLNFF